MGSISSERRRATGSTLVRLALVAQIADLVTFAVAVILEPALVSFEVGPIGAIYSIGGLAAATAFKLAGLAVVFAALAIYGGRLTRPILLGVAALGIIGAGANLHALLISRQLI